MKSIVQGLTGAVVSCYTGQKIPLCNPKNHDKKRPQDVNK